ncbi:MAG: hypothetical protein AABX89_04775 [Candidatus Thermoplasmatota archaeon]
MELAYTVTQRADNGQPRAIRCAAHANCVWTALSAGARSDDDPVFRALFAKHLESFAQPDGAAFGYARRSRQKL